MATYKSQDFEEGCTWCGETTKEEPMEVEVREKPIDEEVHDNFPVTLLKDIQILTHYSKTSQTNIQFITSQKLYYGGEAEDFFEIRAFKGLQPMRHRIKMDKTQLRGIFPYLKNELDGDYETENCKLSLRFLTKGRMKIIFNGEWTSTLILTPFESARLRMFSRVALGNC
jgi:hypothetical protein